MNPADNGVFVWVIKCSPRPGDTVAPLHKIGGIKRRRGEEKKWHPILIEHYLMNTKRSSPSN